MTEAQLSNAMDAYGSTVYRLALTRMQNIADAEDVYQEVFLRLRKQAAEDWDGDRAKAWLIRREIRHTLKPINLLPHLLTDKFTRNKDFNRLHSRLIKHKHRFISPHHSSNNHPFIPKHNHRKAVSEICKASIKKTTSLSKERQVQIKLACSEILFGSMRASIMQKLRCNNIRIWQNTSREL